MKHYLMSLMQEQREFMNSCSPDESDYATFELNKRMLQRISEVENTTKVIYDTYKQEFLLLQWKFDKEIYCKPYNCVKLHFDFFWKLMHPDDQPFVLDTETKAYEFIKSLPSDERKNYKLMFNFRMKNQFGNYLTFTHQSIVLELDKHGEVWLILVFIDLISRKAYDKPCWRRMMSMTTGKLCLFYDEENHCKKLFTKQEVVILELISQGFDNLEIAKKLFISLNTMNNHRKNILKKSKAKNIAQALIYAKRFGVI